MNRMLRKTSAHATCLAVFTLVGTLTLEGVASPAPFFFWQGDDGGSPSDWGAAENWDQFSVPDFLTEVIFDGSATTFTVNLNGSRDASQVRFDSGTAYTLNGVGNTLTLDLGMISAAQSGRTYTMNCDVACPGTGSLILTNAPNLVMNGAVSTVGALSILAGGSGGIIELNGANSLGGGLDLVSGTLGLGNDLAAGSDSIDVLATPGFVQTIRYADGVQIANDISLSTNITIQILSGAATQSGIISDSGVGAEILKTEAGSLVLSAANTYSGDTDINGGAVVVSNATGSATGFGDVLIRSSGRLEGGGTISGAVIFVGSGALIPGFQSAQGILVVDSLDLTLASITGVDLAGTTPGSGHDQVQVQGAAILGGGVNVARSAGYNPNAGDSYVILTATSITGTFGEVFPPDEDFDWQAIYSSTQVVLIAGGKPTVVIDTTNQVVDSNVATIDLSGTSTNITGGLRWSNELSGATGSAVGGTNWTATAVSLAPGINPIVVSGTNEFGTTGSDTGTVKRLTEIDTRLTVYYDFEGDFNDHPGAGVTNDDLTTVTGGFLTNDAPAGAMGSTMSYTFDNRSSNATAQTDAWSPDLASADQYTIMYWFKGDDMLQQNNNTRLATVRYKPDGSDAAHPAFQVEGFGSGHPNDMDCRLNDPLNESGDTLWFLPDADGVLGNDGNPSNDVWNHIAFVLSNRGGPNDGNAYGETFVNGVSMGVVEGPGGSLGRAPAASTGNPIGNTEGELVLGGTPAFGRGATGLLDDFALFEGVVPSNIIFEIATGVRSPADTFTPFVDEVVPETDFTNQSSVDFIVRFSGIVTNFNDAADLVITHSGTANAGFSITGSGTVYQVTITGISGNGSFTLAVNTVSDVQDLAGNPLLSSITSVPVTIDTMVPQVSDITLLDENPTTRSDIDFGIVFNEGVLNLEDASDIVVTHSGTAHTGVTVNGAADVYDVTVQGVTGAGSFTISVSTNAGIADLAGNLLTTSLTSVAVTHMVDVTAPVVDSIVPDSLFVESTNNELSLVVTFSETVLGLQDQHVLITSTNLEFGPDVCVGCGGGVLPPPTRGNGGGGPGGGAGESNEFAVLLDNFEVENGPSNATFTVQIEVTSEITDLAGNPLAASVTSDVITVEANLYQLWAIAAGLTAGVNFATFDNPDGDPNRNVAEFMRNTDPLSAGDLYPRRVWPLNIGGTNYLTLTLPVPLSASFSVFGPFASFDFEGNQRYIQAYDQFTASLDLLGGFPYGLVGFVEVIPALDGPLGNSLALPALPESHTYRTVRLTEITFSPPPVRGGGPGGGSGPPYTDDLGFIYLETIDDD